MNIKFIIQALCYCDLLDETLGFLPKTFEIYLGGGSFECFEVHKFWDWYQFKKNEYKTFLRNFDPNNGIMVCQISHKIHQKYIY